MSETENIAANSAAEVAAEVAANSAAESPPNTAAEVAAEAALARPRKRIHSGTLFTTAVVLGVLGGVGTGYAVQAGRPPTPLPPLAATQPQYAPVGVYQGVAPAPLPTGQDDAAVTDGDLTALLLPAPAGADTSNVNWLDQQIDVAQDSDLCDDAVRCFENDFNQGVMAIADTGWQRGDGLDVEIRIFRMAPGKSVTARDWVDGDVADASAGETSISMPAGIDAQGYEYRDKYGENADFAQAAHGDLVVSFWVTSSSRIPDPSVIDGVIAQQMGRL